MTDYGRQPQGGWAPLVCELRVEDIDASLSFWRGIVGFEIAYQRPEDEFVYLEREGAQVMLCQRNGDWETGSLESPFGRGVMFQIHLKDIDPVLAALAAADWPIHTALREVWRRTGDTEKGQREIFVQDPDGYLLMIAEPMGTRIPEAPE